MKTTFIFFLMLATIYSCSKEVKKKGDVCINPQGLREDCGIHFEALREQELTTNVIIRKSSFELPSVLLPRNLENFSCGLILRSGKSYRYHLEFKSSGDFLTVYDDEPQTTIMFQRVSGSGKSILGLWKKYTANDRELTFASLEFNDRTRVTIRQSCERR